ncbi:uncharacterized protein LOC141537533 [Cotesia typhae]|uniref:uncharacterized protein LOC141537533 n=1 Tax=Cotesia typhae TaxID=2053667 RepID=UPI003D68E0BD
MDCVIDHNGYYTDNNALGSSYFIKEFCIVPIKNNKVMRPIFNIVKPLNPLSELSAPFRENYLKYMEPVYEIDWSAGYISAQDARELIIETLEKFNHIYIRNEKLQKYLERFTGKNYTNILILEQMNFKLPTVILAKACSHHKNRKLNHCSLRNALVCTLWLTNQRLLSSIIKQATYRHQIKGQVQEPEAPEQEERSSAIDLENIQQHKKLRTLLKSSENVVTEVPRSSEKRKNARSELTGEEPDDWMDLVKNDVIESPDSDISVMSDSKNKDVDDNIIGQADEINAIINDDEIFDAFIDDIDAILKSEGAYDDEL